MAKPLIQRLGPETYQRFVERIAAAPDELTSAQLARDLSEEFGERIGVSTVKQYRRGDTVPVEAELQGEETTIDESEKSIVVESYQGKFRSTDEALADAKIDTEKWEVERQVVNYWQMGSKLDTGRIAVTDLYQVKLWLKRKAALSIEEFSVRLREALVDVPPPTAPELPVRAPLLAELSLFDAHCGKLAWAPESGENYDLHIFEDRYMRAAESLLGRARARGVEKVLYVLGNDYYHSDHGNKTTSGTPLDCDGRWQKAFVLGVKCATRVIEMARQFAEVEVILVPGNHDREKTYCLGVVLQQKYEDVAGIEVSLNESNYTYVRYGTNLLGFTHGDQATSQQKKMALVQTMMEDRPRDYAETTTHEIHIGHVHSEHETVWVYRSVESVRRAAVRVLPSLSGSDAWHRAENYASQKGGELHYYHRDLGRYGYEVFQEVTENA